MLPVFTYIVCETDLIKYMLTRPILKGRIGKWSLALMEFSIQFRPQKAVKGQALANFLADHPSIPIQPDHGYLVNSSLVPCVALIPWTLMFDGSKNSDGAGAGIIIQSPRYRRTKMSFKFNFKCTNNQAKYEALIINLEIL